MDTPLTILLDHVAQGRASHDQLLEQVYAELRAMAAGQLAHERAGHTLQATALVHEAYIRLLGPNHATVPWQNKAHFFGAAAHAMRRILIDHARARLAHKRGGKDKGVLSANLSLDAIPAAAESHPQALLDLNDAIEKLHSLDPAKAQLVHLRAFAGLTLDQIALVQGISPATADRHWAFAKAWLARHLQSLDNQL